ncbi:Solute carrier family 28 member 3 [Blattella germanica]|nr:Solute carrier family 28 member 3 [Blattella germanica]
MGVEWAECEEVARLVGIKTIPRSEMIATYALCGFSNPGAIGILVGALSTLAPEQRSPVTEVAFRAFIAGSATCFLTASIAGNSTSVLENAHIILDYFLLPQVAHNQEEADTSQNSKEEEEEETSDGMS